jgi:hypothetical protein
MKDKGLLDGKTLDNRQRTAALKDKGLENNFGG